jgi:hypothetical protein
MACPTNQRAHPANHHGQQNRIACSKTSQFRQRVCFSFVGTLKSRPLNFADAEAPLFQLLKC